MSDEQIVAIVGCLDRHHVAYVLIGGVASQLHGAPVARTRDTDVVPDRDGKNLDRLAAALRELDARLWVGPQEPEGVETVFDRATLGAVDGFVNLVTMFGPVDVTFRPDGTGGYPDLAPNAIVVRLLDTDVSVASLDDVIRSKEAAGRDKDIATLPLLIEHRRKLERGDGTTRT
jgi:hypothetical protein